MASPFIGQIDMFAGNFAPRDYAFCSGQLLAISQNNALFALLGTTYGGDGVSTFALPDLRGRVPVHFGQGPGLSNYSLGQHTGTESVTLISTQLPLHSHSLVAGATDAPATATDPAGRVFAVPTDGNQAYGAANGSMGAGGITLAVDGGNQPHSNLQPFLCINFIICLFGIFPSRN
jgi:microcystin-dependent protein